MNEKTILHLKEMKHRSEALVVVTAYDYPTAQCAQDAGVDVILVGDSLGNVVLGYESTISVRLDDMVHHVKAVRQSQGAAHVVVDLPFMTYQITEADTLRNAARLIQEGGAHSVKLEGGRPVAGQVRRLVASGIPVMAHIGLTPQSVHQLGGHKVQGQSADRAQQLIDDALALQDAGAYSVVLEAVPWQLAAEITSRLDIPTIGIGAGSGCDGQVLVLHDLIGLSFGRQARFVRRYADVRKTITEAVAAYAADVREGRYPDAGEQYSMKDEVWQQLKDKLPEPGTPGEG